MVPHFQYRQTPFLLGFPLTIFILSSVVFFSKSSTLAIWLSSGTALAMMVISGLWLLSMLMGQEFRFQKIESDGKHLSFQTNVYQGQVAWEEVEGFWISDQGNWVVLYLRFISKQVAERIHLKPREIEENLNDFYAHHILGLPRSAFPKTFQASAYSTPADIFHVFEEGKQDVMNTFRVLFFGYCLLFWYFMPWKQWDIAHLNSLALLLFLYGLSYYPLVRAKQWGFLKQEPERIVFFRTKPIYAVSYQIHYESDVLPSGQVRVQFEPDRVKWLDTTLGAISVKQKYAYTCFQLTSQAFQRFQALFPEPEKIEPIAWEAEEPQEDAPL